MNLLVYKNEAQTTSARDLTKVADPDANVSNILYNRLQVKDEERYSDYSQRELFGQNNKSNAGSGRNMSAKSAQGRHRGSGLSYNDWLKAKDAEKRLKRKLVGQAQNEIKEELL